MLRRPLSKTLALGAQVLVLSLVPFGATAAVPEAARRVVAPLVLLLAFVLLVRAIRSALVCHRKGAVMRGIWRTRRLPVAALGWVELSPSTPGAAGKGPRAESLRVVLYDAGGAPIDTGVAVDRRDRSRLERWAASHELEVTTNLELALDPSGLGRLTWERLEPPPRTPDTRGSRASGSRPAGPEHVEIGFPPQLGVLGAIVLAGLVLLCVGVAVTIGVAYSALKGEASGFEWLAVAASLALGVGMTYVGGRILVASPNYLRHRLRVDRDGIALDSRGDLRYSWAEIAGFESGLGDVSEGIPPVSGLVRLRGGERVELHALRREGLIWNQEEHALAIDERVRVLNRLFSEATRER